jgi:hypothetical protein
MIIQIENSLGFVSQIKEFTDSIYISAEHNHSINRTYNNIYIYIESFIVLFVIFNLGNP